jgi:integrase
MAEKQKRNAKGAGSLRKVTKEKNGKKYEYWEGQITVGIDPGTGKQKRKYFTGKTQGEVLKAMQAAQNAVNEGSFFEPTKLTVKEWFEVWLSDYMAAVKPLTVQQYRSMSETHIYPALGAVKLKDLKAPQLQRFYNQLAKDGKAARRKNKKTGKMEIVKTGEPLSAKTIRNIHDIISKALNTAVRQGMINENVSQRCTLPKVIHEEVKPLTEEQQKEFLAAIQNHDYKNIFTLTMFTGLREGEAVGLTWDCIDFKKRSLKVYRQLQRTPGKWSEWRFAPLKNSKTRTIRLSPFVLQMLEKQKIQQRKDKLAAGELWSGFQTIEEQETDFVFTDARGEHLNSSVVYENFKKIAAQIGIPAARFHDLRHTFAVNSLQCGDDPKTVQEALGHATAAFTLNVYGHVSERMQEEHANRQQEYIKSLGL